MHLLFLRIILGRVPKTEVKIPVYQDALKTIITTVDSRTFEIRLPANPSTSSSWFIVDDFNHRLSHIKGSHFTPSSEDGKPLGGAAGERSFLVEMSKSAFNVPYTSKLHFVYARPWEIGGNIKEFTVRTSGLVDKCSSG